MKPLMRLRSTPDRGPVDASTRAAFTSFLSSVGPEPVAELLRTARQRVADPGDLLVDEEEVDRAGVLMRGMLGTAVSLPDGRRATIHYVRPVAFFGLPTIFFPIPLSVSVIRPATVLELNAGELRRLAHEYPDFGWFLSGQLSGAVRRVPSIIEEFGFKTVSQRVASHLLSLSEPDPVSGVRMARLTQAALADYVGSAREVVARSLRMFADEGMVTIGHGSVRILDEVRLQAFASYR